MEKNTYRGALAVSCLSVSHTCVCIYMCILFAHRDQKCFIWKCCLSFHYNVSRLRLTEQELESAFLSRTNRAVWSHSHVYCCTFQRSVHDWSASPVCTLKAEDGHLSVLNFALGIYDKLIHYCSNVVFS